jgi:hypothetical protein
LAEAAQSIQQHLQALWPDYSGDLDALGKGKGKKGGAAKGANNYGSKGGGGKGPMGAINGSCWNCGTFGHWLDFSHDLSDFHFLAFSDLGVEDAGIGRCHFLRNFIRLQGEEEFVAGHALAVFFMPDG